MYYMSRVTLVAMLLATAGCGGTPCDALYPAPEAQPPFKCVCETVAGDGKPLNPPSWVCDNKGIGFNQAAIMAPDAGLECPVGWPWEKYPDGRCVCVGCTPHEFRL